MMVKLVKMLVVSLPFFWYDAFVYEIIVKQLLH